MSDKGMSLFIEPFDVWLFRDGRPFSAGSDHAAESLFPPPPSVIQGAIRSYHITVLGISLTDRSAIRDAIGTAEDPKDMRIRGPFIAREGGDGKLIRYFPLPFDVIKVGKGDGSNDDNKFRRITPRAPGDLGVLTGAPTSLIFYHDGEMQKIKGSYWVSEGELFKYLGKGDDEFDAIPAGDLYVSEDRVGIALSRDTRTTVEGMLYHVSYVRPRPGVGIEVWVTGLKDMDTGGGRWPDEGVLKLGGESRAGRFRKPGNGLEWEPLPCASVAGKHEFRVYFATPAYFEGGWQPKDGDWSEFFTGNVKLVAAAIGKYMTFGGYDLAKGDHKPSRRFVPPGSVYYFKANGAVELSDDCRKFNAVTDWGAAFGFGQVLIGEW